jgi:Phage virion morphogenesis family.
MITIEIDDQQIRQAFTRLVASAKNPRPVLEQIGELLVDSTKQRFATSTAPDGTRWAENSDVTLLRYLGQFKGSYRKDGGLTQKGAARLGSKKPLIGETGMLSSQIFSKVEGGWSPAGWQHEGICRRPAIRHETGLCRSKQARIANPLG